MLLQSEETQPPPGVVPPFENLAAEARGRAVPNEWIKIPASEIFIGLDDAENDEGPDRYFGWDIEKPRRRIKVAAFEAKARPISVGEYAHFLKQTNKEKIPASWTTKPADITSTTPGVESRITGDDIDGKEQSLSSSDQYLNGKYIRTVYGPVPLKFALDWPVFASFNELHSCAIWMGGRIPTEGEVRSIYECAEAKRSKDPGSILAKKISAVNGSVPHCVHGNATFKLC